MLFCEKVSRKDIEVRFDYVAKCNYALDPKKNL
jgi:hypothetical protein